MALIKCKECNKEISSSASQCPHCGYKETKRTNPVALISIAILIFLGIIFVIKSNVESNNLAVEACVNRGVSYFKEAGSYPTLQAEPNKGRAAEDVARERCNRTTSAF